MHLGTTVRQAARERLTEGADLADGWLEDALGAIFDACGVSEEGRATVVDTGVDEGARDVRTPPDDPEWPVRVENARRALVFAALALEARLNRVLAGADPVERDALAHLSAVERFRLAPRLVSHLEAAAEDAALYQLVVEVFLARDQLVDGDGVWRTGDDAARFSPNRARAIVEESARICCFLATLVDGIPAATAKQVWRAASALTVRADRLSAARPPQLPLWEWDWDGDAFPPRLIGS